MDSSPRKCPVTGASSPNRVIGCPIGDVFGWLREKVAHATKTLPIHDQKDTKKKELIQASIAFSDYLIPLIEGLTPGICERIDKIKSKDIITTLFLSTKQEAEKDISQIFTLNLLDARLQTPNETETLGISESAHSSIMANYQVGIRVIIKLWRNILRAYKTKHNAWPTRKHMSSYCDFIKDFSHSTGSSPSFFSIGVNVNVLDAQGGGFLLDQNDQVIIKDSCLEMLYDEHDFLSDRPAHDLRQNLTGASCPALPKIREIAEACCKVLEECYEHALTK